VSEWRCVAQKKNSHLHLNPRRPIFLLHEKHRLVFTCVFGGSGGGGGAAAVAEGATSGVMEGKTSGGGEVTMGAGSMAIGSDVPGATESSAGAEGAAVAAARGAGDETGGESAAAMEMGAGVSSIFIRDGAAAGETVFFAMFAVWHLLHMPPVEALPKKPQPAAQRVGVDSAGSSGVATGEAIDS